jgi:hypothetical protein
LYHPPWIDFTGRSGPAINIGSRFFRNDFFIAILIAIAVCKSGSGCKDVLLFWKIAHEPIWFTRTMENGQMMMGITRSGIQAPVLLGGSTPFGGMNGRFSHRSDGCFPQQQKICP